MAVNFAELIYRLQSDIAAKAKADADALDALARGAQKAGAANTDLDHALAGTGAQLDARRAKVAAQAQAITAAEAAERSFRADLDATRQTLATGNATIAEAASEFVKLRAAREGGTSNFASNVKADAAALQELVQRTKAAGGATTEMDQSFSRATASYDTRLRKIDAAASAMAAEARAQRAYEANFESLTLAVLRGNRSLEAATEDLERFGTVRDTTIARGVASALKQEEQFTGIASAAKAAAEAERQLAAETQAWVATADPAAAAQARLNAAESSGQKLLAAGRITREQYTAGLAAMGAQAKSSGSLLQSLGIQSIDVFQQMASGAPVFTTLIQQGSQVAQVAAVQGGAMQALKTAFSAVTSVTGLTVIGIGGVVAALAALGFRTESLDRQLKSTQTALRTSRTDYEAAGTAAVAAAKSVAETGLVTSADALKASQALSAAGFKGSAEDLRRLVLAAADAGTAMGGIEKGAEVLATGLRSPTEALKQLYNKDFPGVEAGTVRWAAAMEASGNRAAAFGKLMEVLGGQLRGAAQDGMTPMEKALNRLYAELNKPFNGGHTILDTIGIFAVDQGIKAIDDLRVAIKTATGYVDILKTAWNLFKADWNELLETPVIAGMLKDVSEAVASLGPQLNDMFDKGMKAASAAKIIFGQAFDNINTNYGRAKQQVEDIWDKVNRGRKSVSDYVSNATGNPWDNFTQKLEPLQKQIEIIFDKTETGFNAIGKSFSSTVDTLRTAWGLFAADWNELLETPAIAGILENISDKVALLGPQLSDMFNNAAKAADAAKPIFGQVFDNLNANYEQAKKQLDTIWDKVRDVGSNIGSSVGNPWENLTQNLDTVQQRIEVIINKANSGIASLGDSFGTSFDNAMKDLQLSGHTFEQAFDTDLAAVGNRADEVKLKLSTLLDGLPDLNKTKIGFSSLGESFGASFDGALKDVQASGYALEQALGADLTAVGNKADEVKPKFTSLLDGLKESTKSVMADLKSEWTGLPDFIASLSTKVETAGKDFGSNFIQSFKNAVNSAPSVGDYNFPTNATTGARGLYQVVPDPALSATAGKAMRYGYNIDEIGGNIAAGLTDLKTKFDQAKGNIDKALAAYGGHVTKDPTEYVAGVKSADIKNLPTDISGMIDYWGDKLGMPEQLIEFGKKLPLWENRGSSAFGGYNPASRKGTTSDAFDVSQYSKTVSSGLTDEDVQRIKKTGSEAARSIGSTVNTYAELAVKADQIRASMKLLDISVAGNAEEFKHQQVALTEVEKQMENTKSSADLYNRSISEQDQQLKRQTAAYEQGTAAIAEAAAATAAESQARQDAGRSLSGYIERYQQLLPLERSHAQTVADNAQAAKNYDLTNTLQQLQSEASLIGLSTREREIATAGLRAEAEARRLAGGELTTYGEKSVEVAQQTAALSYDMNQQKSIMSSLAGQFTSAFDAIGNAITTAFVNGSASAVNWGNVMKSVASQVIQQFLKLAVINPIINGLFNQDNPTLGTAFTALAGGALGGGSGSSSGGGLGGIASNVGTLGTGYSLISNTGLGNVLGLSNLGQSLGLTGPGGFLTTVSDGISSIGTGITKVLGTTIYTVPAGGNGLGAVAGAEYGVGNSIVGAGTPLTIGQAIGGVGLGYGAGSLLGGYVQSSLGKTGPGAQIGSGLGAVAGTIIGSTVGLPIVGGLVGGLLGGGVGGLFGPKKASSYSSTELSVDQSGKLVVGKSSSQIAASNLESTTSDVKSLNQYLSENGLQLVSIGKLKQTGTNTPGSFQDPSKYGSISEAFSQFRFSAKGNDLLTSKLSDKSFGTDAELQTYINEFVSTQKAISSFFNETVPSMTKSASAASGTAQEIARSVAQSYNDAIQAAENYKSSIYIAEDQIQSLSDAERQLTTARDDAVRSAVEAAEASIKAQASDYSTRYLSAKATNDNDIGAQRNASLASFDRQQDAERASWKKTLTDFYGDSVTSTQGYADQMLRLEMALGEERVQTIKASNLAIFNAQKSANSVTFDFVGRYYGALAANTNNLQTKLDTDLAKADAAAFNELSDYKNTLLSSFGEGFKYSQDYADRIAFAEKALGQERLQLVVDYNKAIFTAQKAANSSTFNFDVRYWRAVAANTNSLKTKLDADLASADAAAFSELADYRESLLSSFGDSFRYTQDYADRIARAEKALGEERLQIVSDYNKSIAGATGTGSDSARSTALSMVKTIRSFVDSLTTGDLNPESPTKQYEQARAKYTSTASSALSGDKDSLDALTGAAQTFLNASKTMFGGGLEYTANYRQVIDDLARVQEGGADWLTNVVMQSETRTQTATLVDELRALGVILTRIRQDLASSNMPARAAAA